MKLHRFVYTLAAMTALLGARASAEVVADPALPPYKPSAEVTGTISAAVPPHLQLMMGIWIDAFKKVQPKIEITQVTKETDLGLYKIALGPNTDECFEGTIGPYLKKYNYDPYSVPVSMGGLFLVERPQAMGIFVHPDNPLKKITLAQLDAIYSSTRRRGEQKVIATWGQLGLTGEWADKPIHAYIRPPNNRVTWYFRDDVLLGGLFRPGYIVPGKGASDEVVTAVEKDRYGISWGAMGYKTDKVNALAVGSGDKFGSPTPEDVAGGQYPLARILYMCVNRKPGAALDPAIKEFLTFVLSKDGQDLVAANKEDGFLPVYARLAQIHRSKFEELPASK